MASQPIRGLVGGPKSVGGTTHVRFACQKCSQPLKLETSFKDIDKGTFDGLTKGINPCCNVARSHVLKQSKNQEFTFILRVKVANGLTVMNTPTRRQKTKQMKPVIIAL